MASAKQHVLTIIPLEALEVRNCHLCVYDARAAGVMCTAGREEVRRGSNLLAAGVAAALFLILRRPLHQTGRRAAIRGGLQPADNSLCH